MGFVKEEKKYATFGRKTHKIFGNFFHKAPRLNKPITTLFYTLHIPATVNFAVLETIVPRPLTETTH